MMKKLMFLGFFIVLVFIIVGYFYISNQKNDSVQENIEKKSIENLSYVEKKSIENPSDLALSLSDFPTGWEIGTRGERTSSDVQDYEIELGWKKGYNIVFRKPVGNEDIQITELISEYPMENMLDRLNASKEFVKEYDFVYPNGVRKYYLGSSYGSKEYISTLDNSFIGEQSVVYKSTPENNKYYTTYYIEFVKDNFYIELYGYDYELLKDLAKKIEDL